MPGARMLKIVAMKLIEPRIEDAPARCIDKMTKSAAAPGVPTPFVASVVDCDGTQVRANLVNVEPDPEHIRDGMKVRLATYSIGTDSAGTEAIGFGFEPAV